MVVRSGKHAELAGSCDRGCVFRHGVSYSCRVAGDLSLLDIISCFGTNEETLMPEHGIDVRCGALKKVHEGTSLEVGLLEIQIELCALGLGAREEVC